METFFQRKDLDFGEQNSFSLILDIFISDATSVRIRGFTKAGFFTFQVLCAAQTAVQTITRQINDVPISVSVDYAEATGATGTAFAALHLAINSDRIQLLCQGAITAGSGINGPNQIPLTDEQQNGDFCVMKTTNPAAGSEISAQVEGAQVWEILAISVTLVCDANAANRTVNLVLGGSGPIKLTRAAGTTQQATETQLYTFIAGGTTQVITADVEQEVALPVGLFLVGGSSIATITTNKQAGDNYGVMSILVRRHWNTYYNHNITAN